MYFIRKIIQTLLCLLVFSANSALALAYPYTNSFDTASERAEWTLGVGGDWAISTSDHNNWIADSPAGFLDNNPAEVNQAYRNTNQEAMLTDYVAIPITASQPTLTYRYKSVLIDGSWVYMEVQTEGSSSWTTLVTYSSQHNQANHTIAEIDLSAYKGLNIRVRFRQYFSWQSGARLFVVDDLSIADFSIENFAYPYTNNFDTAGNQDDWNVTGDWGRSTSDHNNWTANSPTGYLDNNPSEQSQNNHQTGHDVTMTGSVLIPTTASQPTLTYRYKSNLSVGGWVYLELQTPGSSNWTTLLTYSDQNDQADYTIAELDLSAYKGQSIRLRFRQYNSWQSGTRLFVVDDLSIADFSIEAFSYPYTNNFDTADKQDDWNTEGDWDISTVDHNNWTAESPTGYLDNNYNEVDQRHHTTAQVATLNGYISIPNTAIQPTLSYRYKSDLSINGNVYVEIQTQGTTSWTTIFTYDNQNDRGRFITTEVDLSAYKGENIRLRFRQYYSWQYGARMFVVDNLSIADFSIETFSYPYTNNFDSDKQLEEWNTEGDWDISTTNHNNWSAKSPTGFLDNNRNEIEQRNHSVGQLATMNGYVSIPVTSIQPTLHYQYKSDLSIDGEIFVEVQTQGSTSWTTLSTHTTSQDQSTYTASQNDLSAYNGQSIRIRFRQEFSWHYGLRVFTVDDFCISDLAEECVFSVQPVAEWRLDELLWNGTVDEVKDSRNNLLHGAAKNGVNSSDTSPAVPGNQGTCRYGEFDGSNDFVTLGNPAALNFSGEITLAAWIRPDLSNTEQYIIAHGYRLSPHQMTFLRVNSGKYEVGSWNGVTTQASAAIPAGDINTNTWIHLAGVYDGTAWHLYRNGVQVAENITATGAIQVNDNWAIGATGSRGRYFNGGIDEARIYNTSLSAAQIGQLMNETRTCAGAGSGPDHFLISHDGAGIHCAGETIQVSVKDSNDQIITDHTGTITLDTQAGTGSWSIASGAGVFNDATSDDGLATYSFDASDNGIVSFSLDYQQGSATFNIDVYEGSVRDDDSEGDITFTPSGFILTPAVVGSPPINSTIPTQLAADDFNIHITAFGVTATDPVCGVIESYTGTKTINFLGSYANPVTGTMPISINGSNIAMTSSASSQSVIFTSGKAQLVANYKDAGLLSMAIDDSTGANVINGATNDFVVKPSGFDFSIKRSSNNFVNPVATDENGVVFVAAGKNFDVEVTPVNLNGDTTPNYGNESTSESIKILHSLVAPVGGEHGILSGTLTSQGSGVFSDTFNWSEVGIIDLAASVADNNYLGTGDINSNSGNVGRFTPHHFEVSNKLSGALDTSCPSGGGFNYIGQPFGYAAGNQPEFDIVAKNLAGATTLNYKDNFVKLGAGSVIVPQVDHDNSNTMSIIHQQAVGSFVTVSDGIFKYTFGSDQFTYDRTNTPAGSFNSDIELVIDSIIDSDGVTDNFSTTEKLEPIAVNLRYGRLMIDSAFGSELVDLVLPINVQLYDNGIGDFVTHGDDACSFFSVLPLEIMGTLNPALVATSLLPLVGGETVLTITAPGAGNTGSLGVTLDAPAWLEFDWGRPLGEANRLEPKATASFGIYSGNDAFIYRREIR